MSKKPTSAHSDKREFRPSATRFAVAFMLVTLLGVALAQPIPQDSAAARSTTPPAGVLFQISTLDALSQGIYDASFSVAQAKQHGDFGLGTYEGLDGELIALDGHYYHMRSNGVLTEADDSEKIPFAAVTRFRPDVQFSVRAASLSELAALIDAVLPSKNFFYAVRIHGPFISMSTRAIPQQFLPYPPLAQLIPMQTVFTYSNVVGTAVDIRCPAYFSGINQVGHHFHFVSDDKKAGGHALSFTTGDVIVDIQVLRQYALWLPNDEPFQRVTLPIQ